MTRLEQILRDRPDLREHLANMPRAKRKTKPKPFVAPVAITDPAVAAAAKANPESLTVRVSAIEKDGVVRVARPQKAEVVYETDEETRARKERQAAARMQRERLEQEAWLASGVRIGRNGDVHFAPAQGSGTVISAYDPLAGLDRGGER